MKDKDKRPVGRPANPLKNKFNRMVYVSDEVREFYVLSGGGSFSKGVEVIFKKLTALNNKK